MSIPRDEDRMAVTWAGLRALFAHVDEVVFCCDTYGTVRFVSEACRNMFGYAPELFVGRNIVEIVHPDQVDDALEAIARWEGRSGLPFGEPVKVLALDGSWIESRYDAALGPNFGDVGSLIITVRPEASLDIVGRELRARALNDDRIIRLSSLFLSLSTDDFDAGLETAITEIGSLEDVTRASVWRAENGRLVRRAMWASTIGEPSLPLPRKLRLSDFLSLQMAANGHDTFFREPWNLGVEYEAERIVFQKAGSVASVITPMVAGEQFVGIIWVESTLRHDFSATYMTALHSAGAILAEAFIRNDVERSLETQALTDRVTGMSNRWAFDVELECALDDVAGDDVPGVALAVIDLDRFKTVNDTYGHALGDRLLFEIAERFRALSDAGTTFARLGGDEILALITDVAGPDIAVRSIRALVASLDVPFHIGDAVISLTASAGVAYTADGDTEPSELMGKADVAMYQVKSQGGDGVALAEAEAHRVRSARLRREAELRELVEAGGMGVHYQPEIELATGRLLGAEALARWEHPHHGLLTAAEFIPIAESGGMISALGRQVLVTACRTASAWIDSVDDGTFLLRVNVASRQLRQEDFVDQVAEVLADTGYPASALCLELTESSLLWDPVVAAERFTKLRELGVGLAVDDFGTGYSSYLQLRSLPITALKIDRSFVTELPASRVDAAIVVATLELASALGLTATAEGVETEVQRDALIELGCPAAQGFLLGRPMPANTFAKLFGLDS